MKKLLKVLLAGAFALTLAGCGSSTDTSSDDSEDKTITVGATAVPHAAILNDVVKDLLAEDGWTLDVVEFTDYVQPNTSLQDGDLDANYFQTLAYMEEQNEERSLNLVAVAGIHYEAMALYSNTIESLDDLADGATIAIPNDGSNESRALALLAANGLIELEDTDDLYTLQSITSNPKNLEFAELEAANLPNNLADVDGAVINGNYALDSGITETAYTIIAEDFTDEEAAPYINYLVVKEGNEDSDKTQALIAALQSDEVEAYIEEQYGSSVVAKFTTVE
ncbi:MAG: MetQ/NlpA family ABC transporter substrate-binding protein [Erysipelotrichaceae bacterium]|nr:MetQ/NlpA family ABC transporter substrate-binding protein [Erysipelotrichaceae bacterium]